MNYEDEIVQLVRLSFIGSVPALEQINKTIQSTGRQNALAHHYRQNWQLHDQTGTAQTIQSKKGELHSKERLRLDDLLLLQFQQFDYSAIQTLLTYWPMANKAEPNTHLFSGYLRHMLPGTRDCLSAYRYNLAGDDGAGHS
jgi:hypothetical protein